MAPYKIKRECYLLCCLVDAKRMLLLLVKAQCRYTMHARGVKGGQRAEKKKLC